jgi:hypothetical protein
MSDTTDIASVDSRMAEAFSNGSYWQNQELQGEVRDAFARGADQVTDTSRALVPAGSPSSLSGGAAADKAQLEAWVTDKSSPYWPGSEHMSAEAYQGLYRDLIEAEARGDDLPSGPKYGGVDSDMPGKRTGYDLEGLPIHSAVDRDIVDEALTHFHDAGFGVERTRAILGWALEQTGEPSEREFRSWALQRGWSTTHIKHAIEAWREMSKRR